MGSLEITEYDKFVQALKRYESAAWWQKCFLLLERMFIEMEIGYDSPKIAMNVTSNNTMPINIGQRYIFLPQHNGRIQLLLPIDIKPASINGIPGYKFRRNGIYDAWLISLPFSGDKKIPERVYRLWKNECIKEWSITKRSGYHKFHQSIYYDAVIDPDLRNELLAEAFAAP